MMEELAFKMASSSAHVPNAQPGHIREDKVVAGKGHEWFMVDSGKGVRKIRQLLKDKRETKLVTVEHTNSYHPFLITFIPLFRLMPVDPRRSRSN